MKPHQHLRRLRPSPALFVALLALIVATGGTSYAAMMIGTKEIRDNSVRSKDVRNDTLVSRDVRDGSLRQKDLRPNARPKPATRWALVDASGEIIAQSGGFTVTAAYPVLGAPGDPNRANGNVYINAGEDLSDNGITATIGLQNTVDQNGDTITNGRAPGADSNPEFSGEIAVAMCQPDVVNCAPPGTGNTQHLVVSPRLSNGAPTDDTNRKRFYVFVA